MLPAVNDAFVVPLNPLVNRPGALRCSGEFRDSEPSPSSDFYSILEYLSRAQDSLDRHRFAALPGLWSF